MAILKSLIIRGARQQVGGMVLFQRKGETIARELAPHMTNPRTPAQMEQRVKLSNLVSVYRANRSWMKDAFEDKKERESDYNAFVSANVDSNRVYLAKSDVASGAAVVGPYKITSGSLPVIETVLNGADLVTNLYVGNLTINAQTTVAQLSQALLSNNNGLVVGMQLSLVINLQLAAAGSGVPYIAVRAYEMRINREDATLLTDLFPDGILETVGTINKSLGLITTSLGDGAAAFILSYTQGGRTSVSSQSLVFYGSNATYRAYSSTAQHDAAIASYGESLDYFLSSNSANGAQSVVASYALLAIDVNSTEYVANGELSSMLAAADSILFVFNKALEQGVEVSAYYRNGNNATKYNLTNVSVASDRRGVSASVGSTVLPAGQQLITFVVVVDGDEYPITVRNASDGGMD